MCKYLFYFRKIVVKYQNTNILWKLSLANDFKYQEKKIKFQFLFQKFYFYNEKNGIKINLCLVLSGKRNSQSDIVEKEEKKLHEKDHKKAHSLLLNWFL